MTKLLRMTCLAASVAATAIATPAAAAPVGATTPATARARIVKPLSLTATGILDFGVIVIPAAGVTGPRTVTLTNANVRDCTTLGGGELTCGTDVTSVPSYNVRGTNGQVVQVIKTASALTGSNGGTLAFRPTGPDTVTLTNSGAPGFDFAIGGEIDIVPGTVDGTFTGAINVTVDY
jgi:Domain of unknown function (DUF4402)